MSLSSLLVGKEALIDKELDSLFQFPVVKAAIPRPFKEIAVKKRKLKVEKETTAQTSPKRAKTTISEPLKSTPKIKGNKESGARPGKSKESKDVAKSAKGKAKEVETDDDDEYEEVGNRHAKEQAIVFKQEGEETDSDEEGDPSTMVHESVKKAGKTASRQAKRKYVPENETPDQKNLRTVFVGNLPLEVASKKPLKKQLQRHILSFLPAAKIESIRFRSIPFQVPTSKLPASDDEDGKSKSNPTQKKEPREHVKERASNWRSKTDEKDEAGLKNDEKRFLNPGQKKKIAFINQEFHDTADTVNAYVVFAHPPDTKGRPANLPPPPATMDPYEAARTAAEKCDGTLFLERMIRVDLVEKTDSKGPNGAAEDAKHASTLGTDPRMSVFVGNLDFASKEEDLRVFFETLMKAEKGPPPATQNGPEDGNGDIDSLAKKPAAWVTRVRIVRDKDTQLGKGFAYIQFSDRECVDELLAMEESKLKFAKRKLRIQRCKTIPGVKEQVAVPGQKKKRSAPVVIPVPKGDPGLGERLAGLSKDERKQAKSSDADRVARRLAKKKARMAMKPGIGKTKPKGKERKRVRS